MTNNTTKKQDVYIYQMGKVASTSIANSICASGFNGKQTHFLGNKALRNILRQVLNPETNDFFYFHKKGQLIENIEYTREINIKIKNNEKVLLISLARNPNTWYWSIVSQQFQGIKNQYISYCKLTSQPTDSLEQSMKTFYADFILYIRENKIPKLGEKDSWKKLEEIKKSLTLPKKLFINELQVINRPLVWFDKNMKVFTGFDVFLQASLNKYQVVEHNNFQILLIKYENILESLNTIKDFLGVADFSLKKDNISSKKDHDQIIKEMKKLYEVELTSLLELHNTRYCKFFEYV